MSSMEKTTPLMGQYFKIKAKYPDAILLFRVGDFYETFGADAVEASRVLGIVLTSRNNGGSDVELAGFPHHSLDLYLPRLVRAGHRVAICEQLEKPSPHKKIVRRGVTEVVTPGLAVDEKLLDHRTNNYLASLFFGPKETIGLAFLDLSTGEFLVSEGSWAHADKLIQSFAPSEFILPKDQRKNLEQRLGDKHYIFPLESFVYTLDFARDKLLNQFEVQNLKGFAIEELTLGQIAAGAVLHYLEATENNRLRHLTKIGRIQSEQYVWLDRFTIRNLELLTSPHETGVPLVKILDQTISPMGARLLKKWIILPLKDRAAIEGRHQVVQHFFEQEALGEEVMLWLRQMGDLERLISKVPLGKIAPREVVQLRRALEAVEPLKQRLLESDCAPLRHLADGLNPCPGLVERIQRQIQPEPPVNLSKGGVIATGFSPELDEYRHLVHHAKELLLEVQQREAARSGITNLKIGFNSVFGYYLEVTNKFRDQAPADWMRKQTLANAERYITPELKQLEGRILEAEEKMLELEEQLFNQLVLDLANYIPPVQANASALARLDCLLSFARVARRQNYCRPTMHDELSLEITAGRHPVIETQLPLGETFVPNDVFLDNETQQIMLITGPNMAGKSALLRQTALICLMAQMGSFVPAAAAKLGWVDKVFTRVGASDNISSGESTFMVEMNETASILNNISARSLVLLDEIGRGTSTYDGISIAWSIAEFLHNNPLANCKTLFATHYHELNELAAKFARIKNFHVATKEIGQKVIFLRKLTPGGSQHSFGIHVARLAGMPKAIVDRAGTILSQLEAKHIDASPATPDQEGPQVQPPATANLSNESIQLSIFETVDPAIGKIRLMLQQLDLNGLTPIDCMLKLHEMKQLLDAP